MPEERKEREKDRLKILRKVKNELFSPKTVKIRGLKESMRKPQNKDKNKQRVNPLKPSMREKKRYMAYEIVSNKPVQGADKALISRINELLGVFNTGKAGVTGMKYNPGKQRGILRVNRKFVDYIRSCFVMIKNLNNEEVLIRTLRVSGMINKVKEEVK